MPVEGRVQSRLNMLGGPGPARLMGPLSSVWPMWMGGSRSTVKPVFFACPLFREFREPGKFAKITGHENLNTVAFQCSGKQKR